MKGFYERSESIIDGSWINGWREFCQSMSDLYRGAVGAAGRNESTEAEDLKFAHYLDCEAHLDILKELFRTYHMDDKNY